jgi:hypothetical protein
METVVDVGTDHKAVSPSRMGYARSDDDYSSRRYDFLPAVITLPTPEEKQDDTMYEMERINILIEAIEDECTFWRQELVNHTGAEKEAIREELTSAETRLNKAYSQYEDLYTDGVPTPYQMHLNRHNNDD